MKHRIVLKTSIFQLFSSSDHLIYSHIITNAVYGAEENGCVADLLRARVQRCRAVKAELLSVLHVGSLLTEKLNGTRREVFGGEKTDFCCDIFRDNEIILS